MNKQTKRRIIFHPFCVKTIRIIWKNNGETQSVGSKFCLIYGDFLFWKPAHSSFVRLFSHTVCPTSDQSDWWENFSILAKLCFFQSEKKLKQSRAIFLKFLAESNSGRLKNLKKFERLFFIVSALPSPLSPLPSSVALFTCSRANPAHPDSSPGPSLQRVR